jgi:hypothetical protein
MTNPTNESCPESDALQAFLEEFLLDPAERIAVAAHVSRCAACVETLDEFRRLDAALRRIESGAPRPGFAAETLRLATARPRVLSYFVAAAAVAAVVAVASRFVAAPAASNLEWCAPRLETVAAFGIDLDARALGERAAKRLASGLDSLRLPADPEAIHSAGVALVALSLNGIALWLTSRSRGKKTRP